MIISICNHKGGVGKTVCTVNLAHALANKGLKLLVVDQDSQSNTTSILCPQVGIPKTIHDLYSNNDISVDKCIYPTAYSGLSILPNEAATALLELELYQDVNVSYFLLREKLRAYANKNFDITLIDSPPNLGMFFVQSLCASDCAIIPLIAGSRFSIDGFVTAFEAVNSVAQRLNHNLKFLKAIINKVDLRVGLSKLSVNQIRNQFIDMVFDATIPINADILKAEAAGETVLRYAPFSTGAKKFRLLADEIISLIKTQ